jgi:hypothetical protein
VVGPALLPLDPARVGPAYARLTILSQPRLGRNARFGRLGCANISRGAKRIEHPISNVTAPADSPLGPGIKLPPAAESSNASVTNRCPCKTFNLTRPYLARPATAAAAR